MQPVSASALQSAYKTLYLEAVYCMLASPSVFCKECMLHVVGPCSVCIDAHLYLCTTSLAGSGIQAAVSLGLPALQQASGDEKVVGFGFLGGKGFQGV